MKAERRRDLLRILHEGGASSQQDIVGALRVAGHPVTQATVSRDLQEVGAAKVRTTQGVAYRLPDDVPRPGVADLLSRGLRRALSEFAVDLKSAGTLVVVSTAPGHAAAVARAIDLAGLDDVAGTVAGDDTIFVATFDESTADRLAASWMSERGARV